jgi:hypothetical protein
MAYGNSGASWFETREDALLTMRGRYLRSTVIMRLANVRRSAMTETK